MRVGPSIRAIRNDVISDAMKLTAFSSANQAVLRTMVRVFTKSLKSCALPSGAVP